MGERDPGVAPPAAPPPWPQRAVLAALLAALLAAAVALGPVDLRSATRPAAFVIAVLELPLMVVAARAPAILGALLLALAAAFVCRPLERRIGTSAPLLLALLVFGSAAWALVWVEGRLLAPLALAAAAFGLAYGGGERAEEPAEIFQPPERSWRASIRWLAVGLLLAELVPTSLLLAGLLLPAALAVPRARRSGLLPMLLGGFAAGLAVEVWLGGPGLVTGPLGRVAATFRLDPALAGRSVLGLLAGRNVGLLTGFAPVLLLLVLGRGAVARPALAATALTLPVLGALLLPFDFAGGWLNLSFLALYGALWHLPARPPRRWQWAAALVLSGVVVWPLLVSPRGSVADEGVGLVGAWPRRHLPYEATLRNLPSRGGGFVEPGGVRFRAVSGCRARDDSGRFDLDGGGPAEVWLAAPPGLEMVAFEFGPGAPSSIAVSGATAGRTVYRPDGRVGFEVLLSRPRGEHRLWFGERPHSLHLIRLALPGRQSAAPVRCRLVAVPQP